MFPGCINCNNYLLFPLLFIESAGVILTTGVSSKYLREPVIFKFVFISSRERGFKYFLFQLNCSIFFKSLWFKILRYCADFVFFAFPKPKRMSTVFICILDEMYAFTSPYHPHVLHIGLCKKRGKNTDVLYKYKPP